MLAASFFLLSAAPSVAQTAPPSTAGATSATVPAGPMPYGVFARGATVQPGLIAIVHKAGRVFLALNRAQLGTDFIETSVPATGLGGFGPAQGEPYVAPARILRFDRVDDTVVIRWPNTYALVQPNSPEQTGVEQSLPSSVIAVVPIVAQDDTMVVIPAAPFLGDVADFAHSIDRLAQLNPSAAYHLDPSRAYFAEAKAFPQNDVIRVDQTWESANPNRIDNAPDPRSVEVMMTYNIIKAPNDGYMPRLADPRVGYFSQPLINFSTDQLTTRSTQYIARWNFGTRTSTAPFVATNPIVFYLSNDIPYQYRDTVRAALLTWNDAFRRVGILDAVKVLQQPADPSWDPEDIRHNMIRWIDTSSPQYGAEALLVTDPRTGEELNVGVNFDAVEGMGGRTYRYVIAPARGIADSLAAEHAYVEGFIRSIILHESGHDLGLQHNFIGSMAYTAKDLQSKAFTDRYGVASSVMEYSPINLWPKGTRQGDYVQLVLGPYDYHAVRYGYAYIPGAHSPNAELPTLERWASAWSNPAFRFASDEDAQFGQGHAIDPRVATFDLTNHPLQWCATQMTMMHNVMNAVANRFPQKGHPFDEARQAFLAPLTTYLRCAEMPSHTIGGEYLSRADNGDPGSGPPLEAVSRGKEAAAWRMLDDGLFSEAAWHFNPNVLNRLTYSEYSSLTGGGSWAYAPSPRHDVPVVALVGAAQTATLNALFAPLLLQRIDDLSTKYKAGSTMTLTDLFDWSRRGIYGDIATGGVRTSGPIRRNLQMAFAKQLGAMWTSPVPGTPADAQALARIQLEKIKHSTDAALQSSRLDELTRAHLEALGAVAQQALNARATIASPAPSSPFPRG